MLEKTTMHLFLKNWTKKKRLPKGNICAKKTTNNKTNFINKTETVRLIYFSF
jgi:hypothetical protein